jgi:Tetracyclin repressor-like, C-terminal domain
MRYWSFMLEQPQLYRLMNGMDGVTIDRDKVGGIARGSIGAAKAVLQAWFVAEGALTADADAMLDELWAVLHGVATLIWIVLPRSIWNARNTAFSLC